MNFGKWLRDEIKRQHICQRYMAEDLGIPFSTFYFWVSGSNSISFDKVEKCLDYLGYKIEIVEADHKGNKRKDVSEWLLEAVYKKAYQEGYHAGRKNKNGVQRDRARVKETEKESEDIG